MEAEGEPASKSWASKELIAGGTAAAGVAAVAYYSYSQFSGLKEDFEESKSVLIDVAKKVDNIVDSIPEPEKIKEIKKSIDLNSKTIQIIEQKLDHRTESIEQRLRAIETMLNEWFSYIPPRPQNQGHSQNHPQPRGPPQPYPPHPNPPQPQRESQPEPRPQRLSSLLD